MQPSKTSSNCWSHSGQGQGSLDVLSVWVKTGLQKLLKKLNLILQNGLVDKRGATNNCLWLFSAYLQQNF